MVEHERMHLKRSTLSSGDIAETSGQYSPYPCPDCSYLCNNAGVLSSHTKVHLINYPRAYCFHDPYRSDNVQIRELVDKYKLRVKIDEPSQKTSPPKDAVDIGNANKLCGINVMSLLDPNQSLTDAVLAMKKKFNLELDGEPFAEPTEDLAESPPCSPLKQLNDGTDPATTDFSEEKQLHFCHQCPARFLFRKELGIHSRFHNLHLVHKCDNCTYTARQRSHLQAHFKVHTEEYQERTNALMKMYDVHKEFPKPRTVTVSHKASGTGTTCIVVTSPKPKPVNEEPSPAVPKFFCDKCPASFFKQDALHSHFCLHGSNNPHKCRICDYAVKTYGNLIKHMMMHGCRSSVAKKILEGRMEVPESLRSNTSQSENPAKHPKEESQSSDDVDNLQASDEINTSSKSVAVKEDSKIEDENEQEINKDEKSNESKGKENATSEPLPPSKDQSSGFAMGSPEFVYPTYCRNGRVKVKRYKCHKCPSAFEKRDQYLIHLSLHGSKQRYTCSKCDYSVKYYANHIQHLRRHQISDEARGVNNKDDSVSNSSGGEDFIPEDTENIPSSSPCSPSRSAKTTGGNREKLSVADKQAMMVLQQRRARRAAVSRESLDKNYWCSHCPYSSPRRDQVESHMRRHILVSGVRNAFVCDHCDYSVPNKHFLRDHFKLHFDVSKAPRPDAYMICDRLELWASSGFTGKSKSKGRVLIFQDKGPNATSDRFIPQLASEEEEEEDIKEVANKIFINPKTFESECFGENGSKDNQDSFGEGESNSEYDKDSDMRDGDKCLDLSESGSSKEEAEAESLNNVSLSSENIKLSSSNSPSSEPAVEDCDVKGT